MGAAIPDLDNVEAATSGPPMAPPGKHLMVVASIEEETKENKNIVHHVCLSVAFGEHAGKVANQHFVINNDTGKKFYKGFLAVFGVTKFAGLNTDQFIGKPVIVWVVHEEIIGAKDGKKIQLAKAMTFENGSAEMQKTISAVQSQPTSSPAEATSGGSQASMGF